MNDALNYAQQQADTFKNSLQYLIEQQNQQKMLDQQALTQRYSNLVNQINQQKTPIQERYSADTQGAYVNKMMAGRQLNQNLSQLGLNTQGFGINQQMLNENAYGRTLGDLATNRNTQLQGVENQLTNTLGQQQADLYSLDATYGNRLNELNQYITEQAQRKYDTEYARKIDEQRYQDQLQQQKIDNAYRNRTIKIKESDVNPFSVGETPLPTPQQSITPKNILDILGGVGKTVSTVAEKGILGALLTGNKTPKTSQNENRVVSAKTSPRTFSSETAQRWFTSTIAKLTKPTVAQLEKLLKQGYNSNYIDDDDLKRILATYGLE